LYSVDSQLNCSKLLFHKKRLEIFLDTINAMDMFKRFKQAVIPHLFGFCLMVFGWWISILNVGLDKFSSQGLLFNFWTLLGLALIIIGAYLPETWIGIRGIGKKEEPIPEKEPPPLIKDVNATKPAQLEEK
jgi:hypothetical protein